LCKAVRDGIVPSINDLVDCSDLLSLETDLPVRLLDAEALGEGAFIRICFKSEGYVFLAILPL
jgi:DNA/RNA-binding domain of Phe-tRNA-synthetase-like protein